MNSIFKWYNSHRYCLWLLYFVFYLIFFFGCEQLIKDYHYISCPLDDKIPFCEYFIIPYVSWFIGFPGALALFMFRDKEDFVNLCALMFTGMTICLLTYVIWPNGIDIRVELSRDNLCSNIIGMLWEFDPSVNVCPSIHCSSSMAVALAVYKSNTFHNKPIRKWLYVFWMLIIVISTMPVKQHSVVDAVLGTALSLVLYPLVYHTGWKSLVRKSRLEFMV